ncbi:ABC transporter ATP-binding protein [Candidatus Saccharibacteria bacterium]|nr:ABC transporter ATP-binding protein [Candidatus Saccharibacteria bacterium]
MRYYIRILRRFFSLGATSPILLFHLIFSACLREATFLSLPFIAAEIIDAATDSNFTLALIETGIFLVAAIIYVLCHHYNYWAYAKNSTYIHDELQRKILDKVITFDQDYTKNISSAEIIGTAFQDVTENQRVPDYFFDFITSFISMFINAFILFLVDPIIGIIAITLAIIAMAIFVLHMKKRDEYAYIQRSHQDSIASLYSQILDGKKEVHSFNMKADLKQYLDRYKELWRVAYGKNRIHQDVADVLVQSILGVGRIAVYFITAGLILKGEYSIATLILAIGYWENIIDAYESATDTIYNLSKCAVAINRVHRLLNYKPPRIATFGANQNDNIKGKIRFDKVSFTYDRKPLMRDVSFSIEPHTLVGIVGKSGSGKSTIFRLLLRLYKPTRGKIILDNTNINEFSREVYASNVSIVTQKPFVFDMTIKENLSLVDPDIEHQIEACKIAGIHKTIMNLEKGYNTELVSDGQNLSAGQKQLLSLARTLLSGSEVLLFDEVTSALDSDTTKQIIKILKELKKTHTVLVITHKPEVMRNLDELLVIDQGRLVGRGTHNNLLHNKYYKLLQK